MKDFVIIMIILVLIFGGNFLTCKYFENSGNEVISILDTLKNGIEIHSSEEKENNIKNLEDVWDKNQKFWIMSQYHETVNSMESVMIECANYYKSANKEQFDISYEKLKRNILDLKNREQISILNIM